MLLLTLACTGSEPASTAIQDTAPPYEATPSQWDGETAAAHTQAILDGGIPMALPIVETWVELVDLGSTEACPERVDYSMLDAPFGCQADTGYYFSGMTALKFDEEVGGFEFLCDAYVIDPDGRTFWCGGESILLGGEGFVFMHLLGTFGYEGVPPWEEGRKSMALWAEWFTEDPEVGPVLYLNGSVTSAEGSMAFDNLGWSTNERKIVSGGVAVRSDHGWYRAILGPAGCSAWVFQAGNAVGQGCVDLDTPIDAWIQGSLQ
ncbi:MAG: hypothetical protein VX899_11130 [Myxococcota bacterium]|nr:hypothetical protein [Myxococcota bacterium]